MWISLTKGIVLSIVAIADVDLAHGTAEISSDSKTISFSPASNWYGVEEFSYTMQDTHGQQSSTTVTLTVNAANDAPIALADSTTTTEDTEVPIDVLSNDSDIDLSREGDNLTILSSSGVDNGSVTIALDKKSLSFTPSANWNGSETFNYTIRDNANAQATASVTVIVSAVNDTPIAVDDSTSTNEDTSILYNVIANDTDVDLDHEGDSLTVVEAVGVDNGVISYSADRKSILFTPDLNWQGTEVFSYLMKDAAGQTDVASVTIVVNPVNDPPVAANDFVTIDEDNPVTVDVLTNDVDPDLNREGDNLTIKSVSGVDHGSVAIAENLKTLTFTPATNWNGSETFAYIIKDKNNIESTANVTITVNAVNDSPHAVDDSESTNEDTPVTLSVLANDTDVDLTNEGDNLTVLSTAGVENASVSRTSENKKLIFTPNANWNGDEEFTYTIQDQHGVQSTATVLLTVIPQEDVSIAVADTASVNEEGSVTIDVLDNDIDADLLHEGDNLSISSVANVDHGTVTIADDFLTLSFTPVANFAGTEVFYYTMKDGADSTSTTTVTVTVLPINDPPTAVNDNVTTNEDTPGTILALVNDLDVDLNMEGGDTLTITGVSGVDNATAVIAGDKKSILFTPNANWNGEETFKYTMEDAAHISSTAEIKVTVVPVNDPPVLSEVPDQTIDEDTTSSPITFTLTDVDSLVADLTLSAVSANESILPLANIVFDGSGANRTVTLTPLTNKNTAKTGTFTITLTVSDGTKTGTDSFALTVTPKNDAPVAVADSTRLDEDTTITINPLTNDTDIDLLNEGDDLTINSVSNVDNMSVQITNSGKSLFISPDANWNGTETFTCTIQDRGGLKDSASVTVVVDDVPEAVLDPITDPNFTITSPKAGEYFKDGQTISVTWTKPNLSDVTYQLQFFDGTNWTTLASGLTNNAYKHKLENTLLHTNAARYQVIASATDQQSLLATGDFFIIDNLPPRDVQVTLKKSDRSDYVSNSWSNLPVDVSVSGGWDLTGITLKLYDGDQLLGSNNSQLGARISTVKEHTISVIAVDPLGNEMMVGTYIIKIDTLPPAAPTITSVSSEDSLTGGTVTFAFSDDPGLSGNAVLILPDGSEVKIEGDYIWNSAQDGVYTFITIDLAGNRRTLIITVTGGKMLMSEDNATVPEIAPPDETISIDEASVTSDSIRQAQGSSNLIRDIGIATCSLFLFLLLLLLCWPNVKIIYSMRNKDGSVKKVIRWKRVFTPDNKDLTLKVNDAESYEVIFSRSMTRTMRGGSLTIEPKHVQLPKTSVEVPDNAKDKFKSNFRKMK